MKFIKDFKLFENKIYIDTDDLDRFLIPEEIKEEMRTWDIITKSPYGESFYSSDKINWGYKPEGSYRVSDHWNFTSKSSGRIHCVTDKEVEDNKEVCLGQYENGIYKILMCYPKPGKTNQKIERDKKIYSNEFYMNQRKEFKEKVKKGDITAEFDYYGDKKSGLVTKYTGFEIGLDNLDTNLTRNNGGIKRVKNLQLYDKGKKIKNIFDMNYIKKFESYNSESDSREYYNEFRESDFPTELKFTEPKSTYKRVSFVLGSNKVFMEFELDSKDPNADNTYAGTIPDFVRMHFSVTYDMSEKKQKAKCFVRIEGGSLTWLDFDYENGKIDYMDVERAKLSSASFSTIKKLLKKYSK